MNPEAFVDAQPACECGFKATLANGVVSVCPCQEVWWRTRVGATPSVAKAFGIAPVPPAGVLRVIVAYHEWQRKLWGRVLSP